MTIFRLELRNLKKSLLAWALSVGAFIFLMLAFYPSMRTDAMQSIANTKLDAIDPAILAAMGLAEIPNFTIITNFFGYVLQFITLALMVFVVQQSATLIIKEESEGTIEYLYAKPVSRNEILIQKSLAHLFSLLALLVALTMVTLISYLVFSDYSFAQSLNECLIVYGGVLFVSLIFSALGLLASVLVKTSRSGATVTVAIVFGTFVLGVTAAVVKKLDFLIYFSPMDWIKSQKLMGTGIQPFEWLIGL